MSWVGGAAAADVVSEFDLSGKPLPCLSEILPVCFGIGLFGQLTHDVIFEVMLVLDVEDGRGEGGEVVG